MNIKYNFIIISTYFSLVRKCQCGSDNPYHVPYLNRLVSKKSFSIITSVTFFNKIIPDLLMLVVFQVRGRSLNLSKISPSTLPASPIHRV